MTHGGKFVGSPLAILVDVIGIPLYLNMEQDNPKVLQFKAYLIGCIRCLLQLPADPQKLVDSSLFNNFIVARDQESLLLLHVPKKGFKLFVPSDSSPPDSQIIFILKLLQFHHMRIQDIRECFSISLMPVSSIEYLCKDITDVYIPYAQNNNPGLVQLLENVKSSMQMDGQGNASEFDARLQRPQDQFTFWRRLKEKGVGDEKKRAETYLKMYEYENMEQRWCKLNQENLSSLRGLADITMGVLDEIWASQANYVASRFKKLVDAFTKALWVRLSSQMPRIGSKDSLKERQKVDIKKTVRSIRDVFIFWVDMLKESSELRWTETPQKAGFKQNLGISQYLTRLQQIQEVVSLLTQLNAIKSKIQNSDSIEDVQSIFSQVDTMGMSEASSRDWEVAKRRFYIKLESVEKDVSRFLRSNVISIGRLRQQPLKSFKELSRWVRLLNRQNVAKALSQQRQSIFKEIEYQVEEIRHEFQSRTGQSLDPIPNKESIPLIKNFSKPLSDIICIRQFHDRLRKVLTFAEQVFKDNQSLPKLTSESNSVLSDMKHFQTQTFNSWKLSILSEIEFNEQYSLQTNGRLMELDQKTGTVKVNYSDKLILLIKQIRQLSDLGYRKQIPGDVFKVAGTADKYYKQALILKRIGGYYNGLNQDILDCQKGLIVEELMGFENCVKNVQLHVRAKNQPNYITWDNPEYLESYINNLNEATNKLQRQNARLKKLHYKIMETIGGLLDYNLVSEKNKWLDILASVKHLIELACSTKEPKQCKRWKTHCDVQLYRVLQTQYLRGVEELEGNVANIDVQVVLKNKILTFKPTLQEIKEKYYKEVKGYIEWPIRAFKGITGTLELYRRLPEKNSQYLGNIYSKSETLFTSLVDYLQELSQWGIVCYLSASEMQKRLKTVQDWEDTIRLLKMKRKDLQRMNDYQRIECFNINNMKFKNQADQILQKVVDSLMVALKKSIEDDSDTIQIYVLESLRKLDKKPQSLEEMQSIKGQYLTIKSKQKEMEVLYDQVETKNKWLLQTTGFAHDISKLTQLWDKFSQKILDFDTLLKEQLEHLKSLISDRTKELQDEIEKYQSKTTLVMPTRRQEVLDFVETLKQYKQEEDKLLGKLQQLKNDCLQFQAPEPTITIKPIEWTSWEVLLEYVASMKHFEQENLVISKGETNKLFEWQDTYTKWSERLKQVDKSQQTMFILRELQLFRNIFPILKQLSGGILEKEHWRTMFSILKLGKDKESQQVRLGDMLNVGKTLWEKVSQIKDLISRAQGEIILREAIQQLTLWCETTTFQLTQYENNNRKTPLIKEWSELTAKVSDNLALISSLKESKYANRFMDKVTQFESKIGKLDLYLSQLKGIQRRWIYLEPIFIRGALPEQSKRFEMLDLSFREIMGRLSQDSRVMTLVSLEGISSTLQTIQQEQERCQKALNDFLEDKRNMFPRFYFLGDEDLLEILGQSKNPTVIQQHLKKLFAAIHSVEITNGVITAINSVEGEVVYLTKKVQVSQTVEAWLSELENAMFVTLETLLKQYLTSSKSLALNQYPSQILCLMEEIRFSQQLQKAITNKDLPRLEAQVKMDLQKLTTILPSLTGVATLKLKSIILDIIHRLSVVSDLISSPDPITLQSYLYTKNFRILPTTSNPEIHMFNYTYQYTFEYQGNLPKLVHTPLTDKCYITLALAMSLGYGGNPYGPAGTGKTETVKSLGMCFGRMVLVFNCDEGLDYKSISRIFLGLVRCGAWGCFDQFNRLKQDQLSAISQSIQVIQNALKSKEKELQLIGKKVNINHNSGIFVTLNPAGKGYGGRSKLPDNLKQLFRPVAMSVPDNQLIAQVLLYSEGFKEAKSLAKKIICLFTLSRQLLSQQQHYDWGLRALKTILVVSGRLIFQERKRTGKEINAQVEAELLIKAIRINTLSKLTFPDMRKFKLLLSDIFPGIKSQDITYPELQSAISMVLEEMKLCSNSAQISKVLQFYEATKQRMGVVLVGPSGCGKTTITKVLKKCYQKLNIPLKTYLINPKSMPKTQLLGLMNNDTRQFTEGVLTVSSRQLVKNGGSNWIILDGDIDPEWIESLNSVLDDNHLLTLPTGQRINFSNQTCFIFQTDSLLFASPATVSRMGMIYLNNQDISVPNLIEKTLGSSQNAGFLKSMISQLDLQMMLGLVGQYETVKSTLVGRTSMFLSMIQKATSRKVFVQNAFKGLTANCSTEVRPKVLSMVFDKLGERNPLDPKCTSFYVDRDQFRNFIEAPQECTLQQLLNQPLPQPTASFQNALSILKPWVEDGSPFVVVGPEGCGKQLLIKQAFRQARKTIRISLSTIHCNSQTKSTQVINKLYQVCLKGNYGGGRILKPKDCSRQVVYLKDINLPKPDKYDTIQLISFLQQMVSHKGFYDPHSLEFVKLDDKIQIVCSMLPSSSIGRFQLTPRFTSIIRILNVQSPSVPDLVFIYSQYFRSLLKEKQIDESHAKRLAAFFVQVYSTIKQKFSVDEERHYGFTPKNLHQVFVELNRYDTQDANSLVESLANELLKNYRDKLIGYQNKSKFESLLSALVKQHFKISISCSSLFCMVGAKLTKVSKQDYVSTIRQAVVQYEREYKDLNLIMLDQTVGSINSIQKKIGSQGNMLLCGRSGAGRRTCTVLASLMEKVQIRSLTIVRGYTVREFKKDMRNLVQEVVNDNKRVVLFMEDHHLSRSQFMEMVNSLLSSGQIPGLFSNDQVDRLPCAEDIRRQVYGVSLYQGFCRRVKTNLKLIISLDCSTSRFHSICASNPAFYGCTILWFDDFQSSSLQQLAQNMICPQLKDQSQTISQLTSTIHNSMCKEHKACQRDYYNLIETFNQIYLAKMAAKKDQSAHLQSGLQKLKEAQELVDKLSTEAVKKQKLLVQKRAEADEALKKISVAVQEATQRKQETQTLSSSLYEQEKRMKGKKDSVELELAEVKPLIDQAKASVSQISRNDLTQLMSFKSPPEAVEHVMTAVMRMFGETESSWNAMKAFLKSGILDQVLNFDPKNVTPQIRRDVEKVIQKHSNSFQDQVIRRASTVAYPLSIWVKAILRYSKVLQSIRPLQNELNSLLTALQTSKKRVGECQERLSVLDVKVKQLKDSYGQKVGQTELLKLQLQKSEDILTTARSLLGKLEDEKIRWEKDFKNISNQAAELPFNSLLASAFTCYLADKDEAVRSMLVTQWIGLTSIKGFRYLRFMTNESTLLKWRSQGLPYDSLSLQNSVIILNSCKVPLIIDPNSQAIEWFKKLNPKLQILNQQDSKFTNTLQLSVRFGKQLLVQQLDRVEQVLVPVVRKDMFQQLSRNVVKIGQQDVDYNPGFKLYLCTRNSSVELPSNIRGIVSVVNYSVTKSGLESKLLSIVINHEKPELENDKTLLLENQESLKVNLDELQKKLLTELAESTGNILQNVSLLESLNRTKAESTNIANSLKESQTLNLKLDKERDLYRPLAQKGAQIFLLLGDLCKVNNMYKFSLAYFISIFVKCLDVAKGEGDDEQKLSFSVQSLYKIVYNNVATSLFKNDRLAFGLHLLRGVKPELIGEGQWELFTQSVLPVLEMKVSLPTWAPFKQTEVFNTFCVNLPGIANSINFNDQSFETWFNDSSEEKLPVQCKKLSGFQKALIVQTFKPEKLQSSLNGFIMDGLGITSMAGNNQGLRVLCEELNPENPLLFIVSPGYDPSKELQEIAIQKVGRTGYKQLSMGGDQDDEAIRLLKEAAEKGQWICFKNLHLVIPWLSQLEKEFKSSVKNPNFRLFLTTESHPYFPNILLETCLKVCYQAPPGIKKNLQRIYQSWQVPNNPAKCTLMFLLAYFHSIIQERRTYIPQGWSKSYQFSYSDLRVAEAILDSILKQYEQTRSFNMNTLYGVFEQGIYGGRIDNPFDVKVLKAYLRRYFNNNLLSGNAELMPGVPIPKNQKQVAAFISRLPEVDSPSIYGLPNNVDEAVQRTNTQRAIMSLKLIKSLSSENLKFQKQKWQALLSPPIGTWKQVYKHIKDQNFPAIKQAQLLTEEPLQGFVYLEASQALALLQLVSNQIQEIQQVVFNNGLLTTSIEKICVDLLQNTLPKVWETLWEGEGIPSECFKVFGKKLAYIRKWVQKANTGTLLNDGLDLSELFHPQVFVNAFKQRSSRKMRVPIDQLRMVCSFDGTTAQGLQTVRLKGLLIQGCILNKANTLQEGPKNLPEFVQLPTLYISFLDDRQSREQSSSKEAEFPVFSSSTREKLLFSVRLPYHGQLQDKILSGVALLLHES